MMLTSVTVTGLYAFPKSTPICLDLPSERSPLYCIMHRRQQWSRLCGFQGSRQDCSLSQAKYNRRWTARQAGKSDLAPGQGPRWPSSHPHRRRDRGCHAAYIWTHEGLLLSGCTVPLQAYLVAALLKSWYTSLISELYFVFFDALSWPSLIVTKPCTCLPCRPSYVKLAFEFPFFGVVMQQLKHMFAWISYRLWWNLAEQPLWQLYFPLNSSAIPNVARAPTLG